MTEQEKREKAIEELSRDCFISVGDARRVIDAGYRKADEVRKETAKNIYKAVLDLRELMVNNDDALCILRNVESWAKDDGVKVEI